MASIMVLVIVFVLDLIAFALAVAAEQTRSTATVITDQTSSYCKYDSDKATGLGVGSFILLLTSQLLIMFASRCLCCGRGLRPGGSRSMAIILFITCWILFFIAEVCLLAGSVRNAYHTKYRILVHQQLTCQTLRKGVFAAGAAFIVFTGIISELYYVKYSKSSNFSDPTNTRDTGVRMSNM
ncbi:hypothetical protein KSS87_017846 [Heliosperma pusillum]|nr:hypothetical protein KSS87_017846 [Heliosperma pusillum]